MSTRCALHLSLPSGPSFLSFCTWFLNKALSLSLPSPLPPLWALRHELPSRSSSSDKAWLPAVEQSEGTSSSSSPRPGPDSSSTRSTPDMACSPKVLASRPSFVASPPRPARLTLGVDPFRPARCRRRCSCCTPERRVRRESERVRLRLRAVHQHGSARHRNAFC